MTGKNLSRAVVLLTLGAAAYWFFFLGPHMTGTSRQQVAEQCRAWIEREFGDGKVVTLLDDWNKSNHAVFAVGIQSPGDTTYSIQLCVVDPAEGTMLKPGAFQVGQWTK